MLEILFFILLILSLGLIWKFCDFFTHHKYWLNRRILIKYLKSDDLKHTKRLVFNDIAEYKFESFKIWVWEKQLQITVSDTDNDDLIGLFVSSSLKDRKVIQIIRCINKLTGKT
ncbi:MAG: hypothetical protein UR61_C0032G0002 [candidate division WS6 bacterium GW2011_GWE1_34_7]|uniref:Uncharacterized protein n=1 Tax=candidate division WS6 bacterium GW2011_GWE1_34_7 TaxID=1619093 RepID=A0A0G0B6Y5_9BACT|nr:MAG: hypothetical protein UR61_C0032G0002 [candidate division WS6 bacterium GW2011_GWE1_34_7]